MAKPRVFTDVERNDMIQQYSNGISRLRIAKAYGTKPHTVRDVLLSHGVELRPPFHFKLLPDQERALVERYKQGEALNPLLQEYAITPYTLRKIVRRHGGKIRRVGGPSRDVAEFAPEMFELWKSGMSQSEIGQRFGCGQIIVSRVLKQHGFTKDHRKAVGVRHGNWKGGVAINGDGYRLVRVEPDDFFASMRTRSGYVMEHRITMARHLGRPLTVNETVHHINGDVLDNRIENLQLRQGKHGKGVVSQCLDCGSHNIKTMKIRNIITED